ncbi:MAG: helix-turn-helix transcriptional regulator [Clostridia bacterium]|nr:helix-turn-helix transcriptional regulator [Clostridia bacterium]
MDKDNFNANVDFVRGQADMIVLSALSDTDKYGLEILSAIQERSKGMYSLKQATLYSSLKRLEKNGYVHSFDGEISNGAKRVYYGLTQMGREHLENDKSYWEFCNFLMSNLISDNKFDPDNSDKPFDPAEFRPLTRRARGEKDDKDQDKEKEVVVKYVYLKSEDIPEGADVVYVSPENIQQLDNNANKEESKESQENVASQSEIQEITSLSDKEYQPSFILIDSDDVEEIENSNVNNAIALVEEFSNQLAVIENDLQIIEETTQSEDVESQSSVVSETLQEVATTEETQENALVETVENAQVIEQTTEASVEEVIVEEQAVADETSVVETVNDNTNEEPVEENFIEEITSDVIEEEQPVEEVNYYQESAVYEQTQVEEDYDNSSFASRPLHNSAQDTSAQFSSLFSNYSRENDVNYVESFNELFDVEDEDDSSKPDAGADIEFLTMKEMVYKYQSKGINIKPYDKRNTMEYYVNRYYFSNKLQFHASLLIFAIFAVELFIGHFICNRGANKISDLWLLIIFALAIFPAIRSVMYVIDPMRKSLANYNPKTSFLVSLLPVVTFPIVFALMGFVEFGANIDDYMSMERTIILPSVLLFNVPLFSIIYTLLYRTYKYHVN